MRLSAHNDAIATQGILADPPPIRQGVAERGVIGDYPPPFGRSGCTVGWRLRTRPLPLTQTAAVTTMAAIITALAAHGRLSIRSTPQRTVPTRR